MKTIQLLNVKGLTGQFELAPITVITGSNSVGKTAILNAIMLSLLGYVPGVGKQASSTFTLSSGSRMAVQADGRMFQWEQKKLKVQQTLPDGFVPVPETMLDLSGLFSLTKEQRVLAIMRACHLPDSMGTVALVEQCRTMCPSFPFPSLTGTILESIEALSKAGKAFQTSVKDRLAEYEAAATRHAEEMSQIPNEPKSLEPLIGETSEKLGGAKQKLRQCVNAEGERAKAIAKAGAMTIPDAAVLSAELTSLTTEMEALPKEDAESYAAKFDAKIKPMRERLGEIRAKYKAVQERQNATFGHEECPTCGHPVSEHDREKLTAALEAEAEAGKALAADIKAIELEFGAKRTAASEASSKRNQIQKRIGVIESQMKSIPELTNARQAILDGVRTLPAPEEQAALDAEIVSLESQLASLQGRQRHWQAAQALQTTAELAVKHRKEYEAKVEQVKLALALITDFRGEVLGMVASTLLDTANRVIEPCLGRKLALEEGDFTLGNACMLTLSGSERMVVYAGLQIALSAAHQPKIVLMDELGVVDPVRKEKLFNVIEQLLIDGTISQFIGVDIHPLPTLPTVAGSKVIKL
jgi:DNA repair exonuclease SbcCD ATPase subunit